jgi:radical SAM superfamily enzyme YgiQ (UPF0313 family)
MKAHTVVLVAMSGVRVYNKRLLELGLTLPGFVERSEVIASLPSLGLLTIAAHTPEHWHVEYVEIDDVTDGAIQRIIDLKPDLAAFSSLTARVKDAYRIAGRLSDEGITTALGGLHASAVPEEAARHVDCVVVGEGEAVWPALLADLEAGDLQARYSSHDVGTFRWRDGDCRVPRYDLLDISRYNRLTIQTTRGCPLACRFCGASRLISAYRKKSIDQVERELNAILEIWDRPFIELADDNTFIDKNWARELVELFARYDIRWFTETDVSVADDPVLLDLLHASNCAQVLIGFESATPVALKGIDAADWKLRRFDRYHEAIERVQSHGVSVNGCFILGFDTDTEATFAATERFILDSDLTEVQITILTPFPGTELYQDLKAQGRLLSDDPWDQCTLFDLTFEPKNMSNAAFTAGFGQLMQAVYRDEAVAARRRRFRELRRIARGRAFGVVC